MEYLDARRLTGPNLLWERPGSILDVRCDEGEIETVVAVWRDAVNRMLGELGWSGESLCSRTLIGGVSLAFSAPIDALYAATEINEYAWLRIESHAKEVEGPNFAEWAAKIRDEIAAEVNPPLLELESSARDHGVSFLWDDDHVSVGLGAGSQTWPFRELPGPRELDWTAYHDIPVGLVTGTNGKTTTVRLATHIAREAGRNVGVSCTDWFAVNDRIIERGDWSGPGGARHVLRRREADLAVLETARGGLLRRGLGVSRADAALITNIAEDHLGDFGSRSLDELLDIKWIVSHAVEKRGTLILNADDERLVAKSSAYPGDLMWFSLDDANPVVREHLGSGGTAYLLDGETLVRAAGSDRQALCRSDQVAITLDGAAKHNVANALAAAALTDRLGVPLEDIRSGLRSVSQDDNPGRCNVYGAGGAKILVDFAHNPAAMRALFDMATALPARRRLLAFGQAGDRPDALIEDLARSAWSIGLDAVVVSELAAYHRGREHGEVFALIRKELLRNGARPDQIFHFEEELESLEFALGWAEAGDLIILLDLGRDPAVRQRLEAASR